MDNSIESMKNNFFKKGGENMCDENKFTKVFRKFFIVAFSMMAFAFLSAGYIVHAEISSGQCGDNLTWSLDDTTGKLTISGTGAMYDYDDYSNKHPWGNDVKTAEIEEGVTSIGERAFRDCSSLGSITIPDSVTSIGEMAFRDCSSLKSITIPDSVTSIGRSAFECCSSLESITIPDSVTSIGMQAFESCSSLKSITIPGSVTSIDNRTFFNCSSLESITIPDSVTSIGEGAFIHCINLTEIIIPESVDKIDGKLVFSMCDRLNFLLLPERFYDKRFGAPDSTRVCYVNGVGTTSTKVDRKGMIWLKEESYGTSAWYGLDNSDGQFPIGSKFWVCWLNVRDPKIGNLWFEYYKLLDQKYKDYLIMSKDPWIFLIGVVKPNGEVVTTFNPPTKLYIELGSEWDKELINAVFISEGEDEEQKVTYGMATLPDGTEVPVAIITLSHFSPYAVFEMPKDSQGESNETNAPEKGESLIAKTADTVMPQTMFALAGLLVLALAGLWVSLKKQRS